MFLGMEKDFEYLSRHTHSHHKPRHFEFVNMQAAVQQEIDKDKQRQLAKNAKKHDDSSNGINHKKNTNEQNKRKNKEENNEKHDEKRKKKICLWHKINKNRCKNYRGIKIKPKTEFYKLLYKMGYMIVKTQSEKKKLCKNFQRRFRPELINGIIDKECYSILKSLI